MTTRTTRPSHDLLEPYVLLLVWPPPGRVFGLEEAAAALGVTRCHLKQLLAHPKTPPSLRKYRERPHWRLSEAVLRLHLMKVAPALAERLVKSTEN